jgi:guanylate kinase
MESKLLVVSGPSGVGKGTLVKRLVQKRNDVVESVSCTTRAPREGELHGREYYFLDKKEFLRRVEENDFLEYDEHFGNYYGTPKSFVRETLKEKSVILEIDVVGGLNAKKAFPECLLVMIVPPSKETLFERLKGRNSETDEEIQNRLARLEYELSQKDKYDFVIVNDDLEIALAELETILDGKVKKNKKVEK